MVTVTHTCARLCHNPLLVQPEPQKHVSEVKYGASRASTSIPTMHWNFFFTLSQSIKVSISWFSPVVVCCADHIRAAFCCTLCRAIQVTMDSVPRTDAWPTDHTCAVHLRAAGTFTCIGEISPRPEHVGIQQAWAQWQESIKHLKLLPTLAIQLSRAPVVSHVALVHNYFPREYACARCPFSQLQSPEKVYKIQVMSWVQEILGLQPLRKA